MLASADGSESFAIQVTLTAVSALSLSTFYAYSMFPKAGRLITLSAIFLLSALILYATWNSRKRITGVFKKNFLTFLAPFSLLSLMIQMIGLTYSGTGDYFENATYRYIDLALDNRLPAFAAAELVGGRYPIPLMSDWLTSDRPPLQTGLLLILSSFFTSSI